MTLKDYAAKLEELNAALADFNKRNGSIFVECQALEKALAETAEKLRDFVENESVPQQPKPPHSRWKPRDGSQYYWVSGCGAIELSNWREDEFDQNAFAIGNVYETKAEAEFAAEQMKVLAEMGNWMGSWNGPYCIRLYPLYGIKVVSTPTQFGDGEMRFDTQEDALHCIAVVGAERIRKYYFAAADETDSE